MLRLLRRRAPRSVETAHLSEDATLLLWAERGLLRPDDLCARKEGGTLAVAEMPSLQAARARGLRRDVRDVVLAAALATAAGVAVKAGGTVGGIASLPLLATAHVWLQGLRWRREVSIEALPTARKALAATEQQARLSCAREAAKSLAGVGLLATSALVPAGLFAKFGAAALTALGLRRWRRRQG